METVETLKRALARACELAFDADAAGLEFADYAELDRMQAMAADVVDARRGAKVGRMGWHPGPLVERALADGSMDRAPADEPDPRVIHGDADRP